MSVVVNSPKSPVTKGSNGIAAATIPNICKMPGPPAPFIPTPLPNIGRSSLSPKGYSKKVKIEGKPVAIKGATFASQGDIASKALGGGLVSANTHGPTKFVGPGALDVKIEGKNVQLLSDPMLNNCGPSGNPPNSATLMGVIQMTGLVIAVQEGRCPVCKENHKALAESKKSKADARGLANSYDGRSTMLGVVHCKCKKKYADQSGATTQGLCDAADAAGMIHPPGGGYDDAVNRVEEGLGRHVEDSGLLRGRWQSARRRAEFSWANKKMNVPAAYPPGACAAQGALLLLMNEGALANAMTERWHSSSGAPTEAPIVFHDKRRGTNEIKVEPFNHGATVPPCSSCELIVPLMLCTGGKKKCAH